MLVGTATGDDAGVYRLSADRALVQTTDFFTPIVDDPYSYGQIAATNALSDVYAMGGRPLTALNLVGIPADIVPLEMVNQIVRGGAEKIQEAKCVLIGGHTIKIPEPIFGYAVTGMVSPRNMLTNANARPGDLLVLTKPIGTGIITTAIKRGLATPELERKAIEVDDAPQYRRRRRRRARAGASGCGRDRIRTAQPFGRHVRVEQSGRGNFAPRACRRSASEVFDLIAAGCIPGGSRDNLAYANEFTDWEDVADPVQKTLLTDAQTSGGLLLCVPPKNQKAVMKRLEKAQNALRRGNRPHRALEQTADTGPCMKQSQLRAIPAVEKVLQALGDAGLPRPMVVGVVRRELAALRKQKSIPGFDAVLAAVRAALRDLRASRIRPLINGTGILIHTNFGRAPLRPATSSKRWRASDANYNNLEYGLAGGKRGGRAAYLEQGLAVLVRRGSRDGREQQRRRAGADPAAFLRQRQSGAKLRDVAKNEVIISRGELVQIGGGFRIPDILETSGARLREVGTTNKTSLRDYARAIGRETALILKVHRSNFFMDGFVESPAPEEIGALARRKASAVRRRPWQRRDD